jgi:hypothetical protein
MVYFGLYLLANLPFSSEPAGGFEHLLVSMFSSVEDQRVLLVSLIASFVLSFMVVMKSFVLMFWLTSEKSAERMSVSSSQPQYLLDLRLYPVSNWQQAKVILKVSTFVTVLLLPIVFMFMVSPFYQLIPVNIRQNTMLNPLKVLILFWCVGPCFGSMTLIFLRDGLKVWWSLGKLLLVVLFFIGLVWAYFYYPARWLSFGLGTALVAASMGWFFYCGARYRAGRCI